VVLDRERFDLLQNGLDFSGQRPLLTSTCGYEIYANMFVGCEFRWTGGGPDKRNGLIAKAIGRNSLMSLVTQR